MNNFLSIPFGVVDVPLPLVVLIALITIFVFASVFISTISLIKSFVSDE